MSDPNNPRDDLGGARTGFDNRMSYTDYLALDEVLDAQRCRSDDPNELLFIVQHQTSELWMKLMLHELGRAMHELEAGALAPCFKALARVSRIMEQLLQAWSVLATMTPSEYSRIREKLGHSSGFQSWQYRLIEFSLGNKSRNMMKPHEHLPDLMHKLEAALHAPSLYDLAIRTLAERGFDIAPEVLGRDLTEAYVAHPSVEQAWLTVYREPDAQFDLYELAEELVDLEDAFLHWRFRHMQTVSRIIGGKTGTGGTAGVPYLRRMIDVELFPELWQARTDL